MDDVLKALASLGQTRVAVERLTAEREDAWNHERAVAGDVEVLEARLLGEFVDGGLRYQGETFKLMQPVSPLERDAAWKELSELRELLAVEAGRLEDVTAEHEHALEQHDQAQRALAEALRAWYQTVEDGSDAEYVRAGTAWGRFLKRWREAAGLSTREAGEILGVSSASVSRYESGQRQPTPEMIRSQIAGICQMAGTSLANAEDCSGAGGQGAAPAASSEEVVQELREQLLEAVAELTARQLAVLLALAEAPKALDQLQARAGDDDPVRRAVATAASRLQRN